jgi:hypothetical protein
MVATDYIGTTMNLDPLRPCVCAPNSKPCCDGADDEED